MIVVMLLSIVNDGADENDFNCGNHDDDDDIDDNGDNCADNEDKNTLNNNKDNDIADANTWTTGLVPRPRAEPLLCRDSGERAWS